MAYQVVSATGQDDLIDQFVDFAVANAGFSNKVTGTVPGSTSAGYSGSRTYVKITKGSFTWLFARTRSVRTNPDFNFFIQMSFDSALDSPEVDVNNTPYGPLAVSCWNFAGPYANVYMFTDGVSVHCAVELSPGVYTHFSIGSITKTEVFTGGEFMAGFAGDDKTSTNYFSVFATQMCPMFPGSWLANGPDFNSNNAIDTEGYSSGFFGSKIYSVPLSGDDTGYSRFAQFGAAANNNNAGGEAINGLHGMYSTQSYSQPTKANSQTQRSPLWPNIIRLRHQTNNLWRLSGHIPVTKFCLMTYLDPGDIIFDEWQVFPYSQKNGDATLCPNSYELGIAYHRV